MHLFSTHGCHVVHRDPGLAVVFPEFLPSSICSCGTVWVRLHPVSQPCLSCVGNHSRTRRVSNPAAVVTVEPSSCQTFPTPACDALNRQPSLGSATVHAWRGVLGMCVCPPPPAAVARVAAANILTTWKFF